MENEKNEKLKNYLLDNMETLKDVVRELISWNGSLDYLDYFENDEYFFNDMFQKADDAVRAVCYGNYNYMDDLVRFNTYGNLESCSYYEYEEELVSYIDDIIDELLENYNNIYIDDQELKNILEDAEDEEEC